jgi:membrane associated rhomboid family serine protease
MERKKQGSTLCPSCRKLVAISAERCPYCGARRPGMWGYGPGLARFFGGTLDPVTLIPAVCIGLYLIALVVDLRSIFGGSGGGLFGILAPTGRALFILGATQPADLLAHRPWTVLTAIYLHGGILHILFNVLWIRALAPDVEHAYGAGRLFIIFTLAGALGFVMSDALPLFGIGRTSMSVGASGSIFGLMAALIVYGRHVGASLMTRQLWIWAVILGVWGFLSPSVDNFAHVGGFAGGWITASIFRPSIGRPGGRSVALFAVALAALTVLGFLLSVGNALNYYLSR